jgi:hypothetical protein
MLSCLLALAMGLALPLAAAAPAPFTIEPPPGWSRLPATERDPLLILALKGPEQSSFVLARINPVSLGNRASVLTLLTDVLSGIAARTRLKFTVASNLETATYGNGLTVSYIRANLNDKPRMILSVMEMHGMYMLGTLVSAVPDTLQPSILGALQGDAPALRAVVSDYASLDGQLTFRLPDGVTARPLSAHERKQGFVAAFQGPGAQLAVMKLPDDGTPVKDQPDIIKGTVRAMAGVDAATLSPVQYLLTSAGTDFIYVHARISDVSGESRFLAGYMPWAYWGYSILAKGPGAKDTTVRMLGALALGQSAVPKLVASSPRLPVDHSLRVLSPWVSTIVLAALTLAAILFWLRNRGD